MYIEDSYPNWKYVLIILIINFSCTERKPDVQAKKKFLENCYIIKPVKNDSKADSLRKFEFGSDSLDKYLSEFISIRQNYKYDSAMDFVTSFEKQKLIYFNQSCFSKLNKPDSCDLMNIFLNSGFTTRNFTGSIVRFLKSYNQDILNFGKAIIFEYQFDGVAENESHFMYIIFHELTDEERRIGKDQKGYVICSDGLVWRNFTDKGVSIPLYIQMIRRSKELYIPLFFEGNRFVPTGHFKGNNWQ